MFPYKWHKGIFNAHLKPPATIQTELSRRHKPSNCLVFVRRLVRVSVFSQTKSKPRGLQEFKHPPRRTQTASAHPKPRRSLLIWSWALFSQSSALRYHLVALHPIPSLFRHHYHRMDPYEKLPETMNVGKSARRLPGRSTGRHGKHVATKRRQRIKRRPTKIRTAWAASVAVDGV